MRRYLVAVTAFCAVALAACSDSDSPSGPVTPAPVASVQVAPGAATLSPGQTRQLAATLSDKDGRPLAGRSLTWTSSATGVAEVDGSGLVTAVGHGTATITASSEGKSGTAVISVALPVASVTVVTPLDTLEAYDVRPLVAILRDTAGQELTGRTVRWRSSDPAVAAVDSVTGILTGMDRGTVTVTATSDGVSGSATRVVVVRYRSVATGAMHACNLASGGIAWCWGLNAKDGRIGSDQLADGAHSSAPFRVPGGHRFIQLATYGRTTCGVTTQGAAYCWGTNAWGALGTGANTPAQSPVPVLVTGGHTFTAIAAGGGHFCGLVTGGQVRCWGTNAYGELGTGTTSSSPSPVACAGTLRFVALTAGSEYTCGITAAGQGHCWGYDGLGNLGDGRPMSFGNTYTLAPSMIVGGHVWAGISAGQYHTCGVTTAGQAYCWGRNSGKLGNGATAETSTPSAVSGGHTFRQVSAGFSHSCAITTQDEVYCWGANGNGQLGSALINGSTVPVRAGGTIRAAEVAAANIGTGSAAYTCAIALDRLTTYCWGRNDVGQLGNGTVTTADAVNSAPSIVVGQRPL
jgi:alpha-tubulin suppressor-like RCC1 family protein